MDNKAKGKRKGGAEKIRLKKQKLLVASADKCAKLKNLFAYSSTKTSGEAIVMVDDRMKSSSENKEHFEQSQVTAIQGESSQVTAIQGESSEVTVIQSVSSQVTAIQDESSQVEFEINEHASDLKASDLPREQKQQELSLNYFLRPEKDQLDLFFKYHPIQNISDPVLKKATNHSDGTNRTWLTYNSEKCALFCSVCLAFSTVDSSSCPFLRGMTDRRHVHLRVEEHEKSEMHRTCAEAYFLRSKSANIKSLLCYNEMSLHRTQVRKRREILERIIDIVKFIGKRGLSYRGDKLEAAFSLDDMSADHGNFLELIVLLSKYDICLKDHVRDCIENSRKRKLIQKRGKGRGSLLTFLSKTTINKVIQAIGQLIAKNVSLEVQAAGMFSVQVDTTQDISCKDQCSIVLRYVTDRVHERLLAVVECESSTGKDMFDLLATVLKSQNIDVKNCIGNSTDGAANMQGQYNGFSSWLSKESPGHIHIWCYAHVLNLVLGDTTKSVIESASFFSLLNDVAVFLRESYLRMNIWEEIKGDENKKRLSLIGETRWWSKDTALNKIFGTFDSTKSSLYVTLIITMSTIGANVHFKPEVRVKAKGYLESLLKYETILTAKTYLRIFEITSPVSKYLQTAGLDILKAYNMVEDSCQELKKIERDFDAVKKAANEFVSWANEQLEKLDDCDIEVQSDLPVKRIRRKKLMAGEVGRDEVITDAQTAYKVQVHNVIFDTVTCSMDRRFLTKTNKKLYADFSCLDPKGFPEIRENGLKYGQLDELSNHLIKFDESATAENLRIELKNFALHWDKLKTCELDNYKITREVNDGEDKNEELCLENEEEEDMLVSSETCSACKNCAVCCYQILRRYNLLTYAYNLIALGYKFLLTLSLSQVACERSFSTLKIIKNRMRSSLSSVNLNSFMLMAVEKELLVKLDSDEVIDKVAETSELLRKTLTT